MQRHVGRRRRRLQQPHQTFADGGRLGRGQPPRIVVQPQPQPLARHRRQAQRIMRRVVPGDRVHASHCRFRQSGVIDRVVLEHHKRVEQLAQPSQALDLGQTKMLVRHQPRLAVLKPQSKSARRLPGEASPAAAAC